MLRFVPGPHIDRSLIRWRPDLSRADRRLEQSRRDDGAVDATVDVRHMDGRCRNRPEAAFPGSFRSPLRSVIYCHGMERHYCIRQGCRVTLRLDPNAHRHWRGVVYVRSYLSFMERLRYQNAIWHVFVLLGAACHFTASVTLLSPDESTPAILPQALSICPAIDTLAPRHWY